jgi:hypothetical protein
MPAPSVIHRFSDGSTKELIGVTIRRSFIAPNGKRQHFKVKTKGKAAAAALARFGKRHGSLPGEFRCSMCDTAAKGGDLHWHHEDYTHPQYVIPLHAECHRARHKAIGAGTPWNGMDDPADAVPTPVVSMDYIKVPVTPACILFLLQEARMRKMNITSMASHILESLTAAHPGLTSI